MGSYTLSQLILHKLFNRILVLVTGGRHGQTKLRTSARIISRFVAALISGWFSLDVLNVAETVKEHECTDKTEGKHINDSGSRYLCTSKTKNARSNGPPLAGTTMDLTLLSTTRALDSIIVSIWRRRRRRRFRKLFPNTISSALSRHTDTLVFAFSSGTIMWAWFYLPSRLPREYNRWIGQIAQVDHRLIQALRQCRAGSFVYGEDRGEDARLLQGMCRDHGWPVEWGDPEKTVPIPCEMVHMGTGRNCHWHALVRFARTFRFAIATNLPLQLAVKLALRKKVSSDILVRAARDAGRSSAFLGAFVALVYYGICLSRTCIGPEFVSPQVVGRQMWDSGLCVRIGCMLCGWSVLIETPKKRQELAMFVAPRALATQLPREYESRHFWKERMVFSVSTAFLFVMAQEDRSAVRGMLGRLLNGVLMY